MATDSGESCPKTILFWNGFPACALLIKKLADEFKNNLVVTATRPSVPFAGLEESLGHPIVWLESANDIWKRKEEFGKRNLIIHTGWIYRGWLRYDRYMKKNNNAITVVAVDNRFRGDFRQYLGALYFRLFLRMKFACAIVPGKSATRLLTFLGMRNENVFTGLYGAYEGIYYPTRPIEQRNNEFLFVGQLIKRKGLDILLQAYSVYRAKGGTWQLRVIGSGPLSSKCTGKGVILESFAQPSEVAIKMNQAKVLIIPSRDDNWGTVVCEAAACGMHIIASKYVGATEDILVNGSNGIVLSKLSCNELEKAFFTYENMPKSQLIEGSALSKEIAQHYTSEQYYKSIKKIISRYL